MRSRLCLTLVLAATVAASGCAVGTSTLTAPPSNASTHASAAASDSPAPDGHTAHWSYSGDAGPEKWGTLEGNATCAVGAQQSPIDLSGGQAETLPPPTFHYSSGGLNLTNNGHTVVAKADAGSTMTLGTGPYSLVQIHYHAPSEHTINGTSFPAELHFVHQNADGKLAVVGVMLSVGAELPALADLLAHLPTAPDGTSTGGTLDPAALLPKSAQTYRYAGSLTTPPCSEQVSWLVMKTPVEISAAQLATLESVYKGNARPVQPLNGRQVEVDTAS